MPESLGYVGNQLIVYLKVEQGSCTIDVGNCLACVYGQAIAARNGWNGNLSFEEAVPFVPFGSLPLQYTLVDKLEFNKKSEQPAIWTGDIDFVEDNAQFRLDNRDLKMVSLTESAGAETVEK